MCVAGKYGNRVSWFSWTDGELRGQNWHFESFVDRRKWHFQESGFQVTSLLPIFPKCQLRSVHETLSTKPHAAGQNYWKGTSTSV